MYLHARLNNNNNNNNRYHFYYVKCNNNKRENYHTICDIYTYACLAHPFHSSVECAFCVKHVIKIINLLKPLKPISYSYRLPVFSLTCFGIRERLIPSEWEWKNEWKSSPTVGRFSFLLFFFKFIIIFYFIVDY